MTTIQITNETVNCLGNISGPARYLNMDKLMPPFGSSFERIGNTMNFSIVIAIDSNFDYTDTSKITLKTPTNKFHYVQYYLDCDYTSSSNPTSLNVLEITGSFTVISNSPLPNQDIEIFLTDKKNDPSETDGPTTSRGTKVVVKSGTGEI